MIPEIKISCLDDISAFSFENHLAELGRSIKSGNKPLQQLTKKVEDSLAAKDFYINTSGIGEDPQILSKKN